MSNRKPIKSFLPPTTAIDDAFKIVVPETAEGWEALKRVRKRDMNDIVHDLNPDGTKTFSEVREGFAQFLCESPTINIGGTSLRRVVGLDEIFDGYPTLREPVIGGLLRRGETMNIVAASKSQKSFAALNIAMCVCGRGTLFGWDQRKTGAAADPDELTQPPPVTKDGERPPPPPLKRFQCEKGRVLIVDNELHKELISYRCREVAIGMNVPPWVAAKAIDFIPLRGNLVDIDGLGEQFEGITRGEYTLIILDAFYKFYPPDFDENSNAAMAQLYTKIDHYAAKLDAGVICIHHTSKGLQSGRSVVDVGAGAGAQSRACDSHLIIRPHEEENVFVFEVVTRSFKPQKAFCCRFQFPRWVVDENADPDVLKGAANGYKKASGDKRAGEAERKTAEATALDEFVKTVVTSPMDVRQIVRYGFGRDFKPWNADRVRKEIPKWIKDGKLFEIKPGFGNIGATYSSKKQSECHDNQVDSAKNSEVPF